MRPDPGSNETILDVRQLRVEAQTATGVRVLLRDVSLTLRRGEVLGVIGESGSGKTTLGLAAMGFVRTGARIVGGQVILDGRDLLRCSDAERRQVWGARVSYVAQSAAAAFNPVLRLLDQCIEVPVSRQGTPRREAAARVLDLYASLLLPTPQAIGRRYPDQVSGGQLQRAMTAMAMAPRPEIIIFDEPTTALDVTTQVEVLAAIRQVVRRTGTAVIYVSHDLAVVAQMADRIIVLREGEMVEEGATRDILERPTQPYTKALVGQRHNAELRADPKGRELLRAEDLEMVFEGQSGVKGVTLSVRAGETVAVVGESGSGKTTLARIIAGLFAKAKGQIFWNGRPLNLDYRRRSKDDLRRLQFVYQMPDTALNPRQRVREILGRPIRFYFGLAEQERDLRVRRLLELVELEPDAFLDRTPGNLSGGEKQRLCIARALAAEPDLVICDEVISALDPVVAQGILALLRRLQQELGVAYLFITHDMATVRAIADRVIVMSKGNIVDEGTRAQVLDGARHLYTQALIASTPEMATDWLDRLLGQRLEAILPSTSSSPMPE